MTIYGQCHNLLNNSKTDARSAEWKGPSLVPRLPTDKNASRTSGNRENWGKQTPILQERETKKQIEIMEINTSFTRLGQFALRKRQVLRTIADRINRTIKQAYFSRTNAK